MPVPRRATFRPMSAVDIIVLPFRVIVVLLESLQGAITIQNSADPALLFPLIAVKQNALRSLCKIQKTAGKTVPDANHAQHSYFS